MVSKIAFRKDVLCIIMFLFALLLFAEKVCPLCGRKYADTDNYCAYCENPDGSAVRLEKVQTQTKPAIVANIKVEGDSVIITSTPEGAAVYLDGKYRANTPVTLENVSAGSHTIKLTYPGYKNYARTIQVKSSSGVGTSVPSSPGVGVSTPLTYLGKNSSGYDEYRHEKTGIILIKIPAGTFTMGSNEYDDEKPVHTVYLDEYYIGKYEVTNAQYKKFCDAAGRSYPPDPDFTAMPNYFTNYPDYPVVNVSWNDAKAYCDWAGLRLPTEAEWEKAARGTDGRKYPWGNVEPGAGGFVRCNYADKNTDYSWSDKSVNDGYQWTAPVGSYERGKSPYGCYDMAGNVWEWCADWYDESYYSRSANNNPKGPSSGEYRVLRGGSGDSGAWGIRCADRIWYSPANRLGNYGFRVGSSP